MGRRTSSEFGWLSTGRAIKISSVAYILKATLHLLARDPCLILRRTDLDAVLLKRWLRTAVTNIVLDGVPGSEPAETGRDGDAAVKGRGEMGTTMIMAIVPTYISRDIIERPVNPDPAKCVVLANIFLHEIVIAAHRYSVVCRARCEVGRDHVVM